MAKIGFEIKNYKKIKDLKQDFSECDVVIISGKNREGKSSLINGIFENLTAKNLSDEPLARGASSGEKSVIITDKNGKEIKIVHTFEKKSPRGTFYAIQDSKKISSVEKIRELIGECNKYTIYDFFVMCRSTDGRRKFISEFLMRMLDKEQSDRIDEINSNINPKNGLLYLKRRDANNTLSTLKNTPRLTEEETVILKNKQSYETIISETKAQVDKLNANKNIVEKIVSYCHTISMDGLHTNLKKEDIVFQNEEIKKFFQTIIDNEIQLLSYKGAFSAQVDKVNEKINELTSSENYKTALSNILSIEKIEYKNESFAGVEKQIADLEKDIEKINKEMNDLAEEKNTILSNSNLPEGLIIESDSEFTYNGFNFSETDISESEAQLLLAKLTIPIYDGPYFRMGNADIYGREALKELSELASKYGKILAMERVNDDIDEVYVECSVFDGEEEVIISEGSNKTNDNISVDISSSTIETKVVAELKEIGGEVESTGNKLMREAAERKNTPMAEQFIADAKARGVKFNDEQIASMEQCENVDFSSERKEFEEGEAINTNPQAIVDPLDMVTSKQEVVKPKEEEPKKEVKPIDPLENQSQKIENSKITDNDIKSLENLF